MAFTKMQREFLDNANHRWNIKSGATRSGKTFLDYYVIPKRIRRVAGLDGLVVIIGNTRETIRRNVIVPLQKIWGRDYVSDIRNSDNTAYLFGERVFCIGADKANQSERLRGSSIKYCYGDEVVTWSEEVFQMLKSRLDKPYSKFDGTCNPEGPNHWFKKFLESGADVYLQKYTIYDNPFLAEETVAALETEYRGTVFYDRYILGEWVLAEGLVYPMFSAEKHVAEPPTKPPRRWMLSVDYGIQNPTAVLLWGEYGGVWYAVDEYYHSGRETNEQKTDEEYYNEICKLADRWKVPVDSRLIIDPSAASFIALVRKKQRFAVRKAKNDVIPGIQAVSAVLNDGKIRFSPRCKRTIEEFGLYRWDDKATEDKPIKENDHGMDSLRYFVYTNGLQKPKTTYQSVLGVF